MKRLEMANDWHFEKEKRNIDPDFENAISQHLKTKKQKQINDIFPSAQSNQNNLRPSCTIAAFAAMASFVLAKFRISYFLPSHVVEEES